MRVTCLFNQLKCNVCIHQKTTTTRSEAPVSAHEYFIKKNSADIVYVNWNSGGQLKESLETCKNKSQKSISGIFVIDNASSDNSLKYLTQLDCDQVIENTDNVGFGRACNIGARYCTSDFILFLNPDTKFRNDALGIALNFLNSQDGKMFGICGAQLLEESGQIARSCSRLPTPARLIFRALGIDQLIHSLGVSMREWDHGTSRQVGQVMGAFFLVRRELFQQLGGFDPRFFVYYEEVDFSARAAALGWSTWYCSEAKVFHAKGGASRQIKATRLFYSLRSRLQYARKHFGSWGAFGVALATWCAEPWLRVGMALLRRSPSEARETLQAYIMLFRWRWSGEPQ